MLLFRNLDIYLKYRRRLTSQAHSLIKIKPSQGPLMLIVALRQLTLLEFT